MDEHREPAQSEKTSSRAGGINVESGGVRLGWNVLAVMATVGLGLYVTTVITPLVTSIGQLEQRASECRVNTAALQTAQNAHFRESGIIHKSLERDVEYLKERVARQRQQLDELSARRKSNSGEQ